MNAKAITALALLAASLSVKAQGNDTLVIKNPRRVTIIAGDSLQKIVVHGKENDDAYVYRNTIRLVDSNYVSTTSINKDRWELVPSVKVGRKQGSGEPSDVLTLHLGVGFCSPTKTDAGVDISPFRSWEIFATIVQWEHFLNKRQRDFVALGFGVDWKNYRMKDQLRFTKDAADNVVLAPYPENASPDFSRIKVFALTGTFRYEHIFGHGFSLGFGPVVNFNTHASIKTRYKADGTDHRVVEKHIRQRPITIDYMANADLFGIPFYLKYSPNDVLKDGGLKFRSLSFGLYF